MKCGLICARRARTSASASAVRDASSSPSSTCAATQSATSPVARTRPARTGAANATIAPTARPSARMGAATASVSASPRVMRRCTCALPDALAAAARRSATARTDSSPSIVTAPERSITARLSQARSARRWRTARIASGSPRPPRRCFAARDARCSVWYVARSTSVPRSFEAMTMRRRSSTTPTASAPATTPTAAASSIDSGMQASVAVVRRRRSAVRRTMHTAQRRRTAGAPEHPARTPAWCHCQVSTDQHKGSGEVDGPPIPPRRRDAMGNEALSAETTAPDVDYRAIQQSPEFQTLRRTHRSFVFPVLGACLLWYIAYVLLAGNAHDFMSTPVFGSVNVAILLGFAQVVTTFAVTMWYVHFANKRLDPLAEQIRDEIELDAAAASVSEVTR